MEVSVENRKFFPPRVGLFCAPRWRGFPWIWVSALGVGGVKKLKWWGYQAEQEVWRYLQACGYNTTPTWQTDTGRQQRPRLRIALRGKNEVVFVWPGAARVRLESNWTHKCIPWNNRSVSNFIQIGRPKNLFSIYYGGRPDPRGVAINKCVLTDVGVSTKSRISKTVWRLIPDGRAGHREAAWTECAEPASRNNQVLRGVADRWSETPETDTGCPLVMESHGKWW